MSVIEDIHGIRRDLIALELREISARLDGLERQDMPPNGADCDQASPRHDELIRAIVKLAKLNGLWERIDRIEVREKSR